MFWSTYRTSPTCHLAEWCPFTQCMVLASALYDTKSDFKFYGNRHNLLIQLHVPPKSWEHPTRSSVGVFAAISTTDLFFMVLFRFAHWKNCELSRQVYPNILGKNSLFQCASQQWFSRSFLLDHYQLLLQGRLAAGPPRCSCFCCTGKVRWGREAEANTPLLLWISRKGRGKQKYYPI